MRVRMDRMQLMFVRVRVLVRDRYDWLLLRSVVATGYLGWMIYSALYLFKTYTSYRHEHSLDPKQTQAAASRSHWIVMHL